MASAIFHPFLHSKRRLDHWLSLQTKTVSKGVRRLKPVGSQHLRGMTLNAVAPVQVQKQYIEVLLDLAHWVAIPKMPLIKLPFERLEPFRGFCPGSTHHWMRKEGRGSESPSNRRYLWSIWLPRCYAGDIDLLYRDMRTWL